jgi:phosphoribosylformimino-5-aminoimidazole carboxamide ribonucleotide (ProFAR) isomerase
MNLDNVGGKTGINYNNIRLINNIYPDAEIIISGGIANTVDILEAKENNCSEIILLTAILEKNIIYSKL